MLEETEWGRLERLIADIESAGRFDAMRFEPHVYKRATAGAYGNSVALARRVNKVSLATARMIVATSWGGFQIMGFNIYTSESDSVGIGAFLRDTEIQRQYFRAYVIKRNIAYTVDELRDETKRRDFARKYNGDADAYAALIAARLK